MRAWKGGTLGYLGWLISLFRLKSKRIAPITSCRGVRRLRLPCIHLY